MHSYGFSPIDGEPCILKNDTTGTLILLYVNDCALAAPTMNAIMRTQEALKEACDLKSMGPLKEYLGFQIVRNRVNRTLDVHQTKYASSTLERFGYLNLHPTKTPTPASFRNPYPRPDLDASP